jgi:peroxiredoxin Q/BCP
MRDIGTMKARKRWTFKAVAGALGSLTALMGCGAAARPDGGRGLLPVGAAAPDLTATDQHGVVRRLSAERGHPVIVYFYPKDGTPGCTRQACAFRDAWDKYQAAGITIFGVSSQDAASHAKFAKEEKLPFSLLADPDHTWANAFGVGLTFGMTSRVSFLIDKRGKVAKTYPDVDPALHASAVLKDAAALE